MYVHYTSIVRRHQLHPHGQGLKSMAYTVYVHQDLGNKICEANIFNNNPIRLLDS